MTLPKLIVLTGIDGSGKSTQAQLLLESIKQEGVDADYVWARWEPKLLRPFVRLARRGTEGLEWRTARGKECENRQYSRLKKLKSIVFSLPLTRWMWFYLAVVDYWLQVRRKMTPLLNGSSVIVCDRYVYDFLSDLIINFKLEEDGIQKLCRHSLLNLFPKPEVSIHIHILPEVGYERKKDGTSLDYLSEREVVYSTLAEMFSMTTFDGSSDKKKLAVDIKQYVMGCQ